MAPATPAGPWYRSAPLSLWAVHLVEEHDLSPEDLEKRTSETLEKACLCEGLAAPPSSENERAGGRKHSAVAICPGPNLAFFSRVLSLEEMVGHIYGQVQGLVTRDRPNMFVNELRLNIHYFKREMQKRLGSLSTSDSRYFEKFQTNLHDAIDYYRKLIPHMAEETERYREIIQHEIALLEEELMSIALPCPVE